MANTPKPSASSQRIDFLIVTALAEERDAVLAKLPGYQQLPPTQDDIRVYYQTDLPMTFPDNRTGAYHLIVMPLLGMGRVQAATATVDAIRRWHPRYILLVGIAGGIAVNGVKIGDLLISDQIVDYELQKVTARGPHIRWEVHRADPRLLNACQNVRDEGWQDLLRVKRPGRGTPQRHTGPIASGDKVIAFGAILERYREVWPKLIGVEMEAAGVATAAFQAADAPGFFMVRGVSDLADEEKGSAQVKRWRSYACDAAAAFAIALLQSGPVPLRVDKPATSTSERPPSKKTSQNRTIHVGRDYFEHIEGDVHTGDEIHTGDIGRDATIQQAGQDIVGRDKVGGEKIEATIGNISGGQIAIGKEIQQTQVAIQDGQSHIFTGPVSIYHGGAAPSETPAPSWLEESAALREAYLNRLFELCGQVFLVGIDRKAAVGQKTEACLNLSGIYTALLTLSVEPSDLSRKMAGKDILIEEDRETGRRLSVVAQLNQYRRLVLLGEPGSGKSTFVNFVTLCLAGASLAHPYANLALLTAPLPDKDGKDEETRQLWDQGALLPVRVILRDFVAEGLPPAGQPATALHLWKFLEKTLQETTLADYAPFLRQHLLELGGLVLLDGLDEVPEAQARRAQIKQVVEDFARSFPKCRIVVTSRTYAYQNQDWQLTGFERTVLAPFTQGQILRFVDQWYQQSAEMLGMRPDDVRSRAELLKRAIFSSDRLQDFARRPLLLTLMASLHAWRGGSLPEKREELYNDAVELLLDWWESRKVKDADGYAVSLTEVLKLGREGMGEIRRAISQLAYEAHAVQPDVRGTADVPGERLAGALRRLSQRANVEINPNKVEEYLRDRAGLLVEHGVDVYTFPHRTFQEYLAACHLTDDPNNYPDNVADLARRDPNRWREVLLLAGAKAARGAASSVWGLVEALCYRALMDPQGDAEDAWGALLAGQVLGETASLAQISPRHQMKIERVRDWLIAILTEQVPKGTPFPVVERALAGNILAQLGDPRPGVGLRADGLPEIAWCPVPEGTFRMGSELPEDNVLLSARPQHTVFLSTYQISRYLVTNAQYRAFIADGGTEHETYGGEFDLPNHPVVGVSWREAVAFCQWLTRCLRETGELTDNQEIRLPTEAEWEKAARGTDARIYPWEDDAITPELANYVETGLGVTSAVGCFPRGQSPYGCEEMAGNVWEWCLDACKWEVGKTGVDTYIEGVKNPECTSGSSRVGRGGGFDGDAGDCRAAYRGGVGPAGRLRGLGFRLLRT